MTSQLAVSAGDILIYDQNLPGGSTLEDHFGNNNSKNKILSNNWDYIVLQEQSQRPSFINPVGFMDGFYNLNNFIQQNKPCSQITTFMTWGYENGDVQNCPNNPAVCTYNGMQSLLTDRYMSFSNIFESEVTPVGVIWKYIRENYPSIQLYQTDGSHPSVAGSYIAACAFYTSIFRKNPLLISDDYGLDPATASIIRSAAKTIVYDQMVNWYIGKYGSNAVFSYVIGNGTNEIITHNNSVYQDSFLWDFGDGTTSTAVKPTHNYTSDGTFIIKLTSYKCYLGQNIPTVFERTVNFCTHTNTIYPNLILCPNQTGTIWTQPADSYQWYDESGNPISGATNQSLNVPSGKYSVLTTVNGCSEMSAQIFVDEWVSLPGGPPCSFDIREIEKPLEIFIAPNPVENVLNLRINFNIKEAFIYDLSGKKMSVPKILPKIFDVSTLPQGTYIVKMILENDSIISKQFIKK